MSFLQEHEDEFSFSEKMHAQRVNIEVCGQSKQETYSFAGSTQAILFESEKNTEIQYHIVYTFHIR